MKYLVVIILIIFSACTNPDNAEINDLSSNKFCMLTGGEKVEEGWSGKDSGDNYCNQCKCMNGNLACTRMACIQKDSIESGEKKLLQHWKSLF